MADVTHDDLVAYAKRWLEGTRQCNCVRTEVQAFCLGEFPDAVGWDYGRNKCGINAEPVCVLVECKTSLSDFYSDRSKPHRAGDGVGDERWYLCPKGVIEPDRLPDDWGLLWLRGSRVYREVEAPRLERSKASLRHEIALLCAVSQHSWWEGYKEKGRRG